MCITCRPTGINAISGEAIKATLRHKKVSQEKRIQPKAVKPNFEHLDKFGTPSFKGGTRVAKKQLSHEDECYKGTRREKNAKAHHGDPQRFKHVSIKYLAAVI